MFRMFASGLKLGFKLGIPLGALISAAVLALAYFGAPGEDYVE